MSTKEQSVSKRVKTPLLLQLEAVECGAAALGIILEYYGKVVPLTELRVECGVSRDGSKASNVVKAARRYGLKAKGFKAQLESAMSESCPYIAFWEFDHFVVIEGFDSKKQIVHLNDPAHGHRKVSFEVFDDAFTGVMLCFEPGEDFEKGGSRSALVSGIRERVQHAKKAIVYCFLAGLLLTLPGLLLPAYSALFLDKVLGEGRVDWLTPILIVLCATVVFQTTVSVFQLAILRRLTINLSVGMSSRFLGHLFKLPLMFYTQRYGGEIAMRQGLNDKLAMTLAGQLAGTLIQVVMMVFYAAIMCLFNVPLTLIGITFAALNFFGLRYVGKKRVEANMRVHQDHGKVAGHTVSALQSMATIKASGQESAFFDKWGALHAKALNTSQELGVTTHTLGMLPTILNSLSTVTIFLLGGVAVINGDMTIGALIAFTALMASFQEPIARLVNLAAELQELDGDIKRVDDVLRAPIDPEAVAIGQERGEERDEWPLQLDGNIAVIDLTFGYSPVEKPLFEDINLIVSEGSRVAFVGGSGSGKTTLATLISGLYQPWSGEIFFDGILRTQIPRRVLASSLATVSQEVFLFEGTVRDNLTLWDSSVDDDTLLRALRDAAILDEVLAMPGGLDGPLLEGGANLSGGQRQRLEIARALVQDPRILVLDEATSALDAETERVIDERLRLRGCTCIIVAHRLSTIRDCDEIIVLEDGKIVERGTHDELWQRHGLYGRLLEAGGTPESQQQVA